VLVGHSTGRDNNKTSNQPSAIAMAISAAIDTQQPCELLPGTAARRLFRKVWQWQCEQRHCSHCIGDDNCYSRLARGENPRLQQHPPADSSGGGGGSGGCTVEKAAMRQQSGGGSPGAKKQPWSQVVAVVGSRS